MSKADGGAAFPAPSVYLDENLCPRQVEKGELGMSLRDYFAGQAMAALARLYVEDWCQTTAEKHARKMYLIADAMLKAREFA